VAATAEDAERILHNIKMEYETNDALFADFPEICAPVRALEGAPQRSNTQEVNGKRTLIRWSGKHVVFPTVEGSPSSGSILMTKGMDGSIRGARYRNRRPDLIIIDDAETRESASNDSQIETRELIIEQDIGGLGGPGKRVARVMLCTCMNRRCVSYRFTDPKVKPSWNGRRYAMMVKAPDREDLWNEYIQIRQMSMSEGDRFGRTAHKFYLEHRAEMDAGAIVGNPKRYITSNLEDGEPAEVSAIQHAYNIIASKGLPYFQAECQNDPSAEGEPQHNGLTAAHVARKLSGIPRGLMPNDTQALTGFIDLGKRVCHWCVIAWQPGARGSIIDYGVEEVHNADAGPEPAIVRALHTWRDRILAGPYMTQSGVPKRLDAVLIDAGNWDTAVWQFVTDVGGSPFRAAKGFGSGYKQSPFNTPTKSSSDTRVGEHWVVARQPHGGWLHRLDVDYWKRWCHDRFLTPTESPGSLAVFGDDHRVHHSFSHHIVSEVEKEEFVVGKGLRRYWDQQNANNHWLDCVTGACAAGSMCGVQLLPSSVIPSSGSSGTGAPVILGGEIGNIRRRW
jgi:hypothetical protein